MYGSTLAQLNDAQFHRSLLRFDEDLARDVRQKRCPDCSGALHSAPYPRKPPSLRFLGPKVYWAAVVVDYLEKRQNAGAPSDGTAGLFWHERNRRYSRGTISQLLVEVLRRAGIKPAHGQVGPRVHDLRHAMVCNRMLSWYQQGINPQSRLPHLATYLGHKSIDSTLVYLHITHELMQIAGNRFRERSARILKEQEARA